MTEYISPTLRQLVAQRALGVCEYCRIHETFSIYSHEVDHVIALKHGGKTTPENGSPGMRLISKTNERRQGRFSFVDAQTLIPQVDK